MLSKIKFVFHILFHPADGFWDMKREKRGSIPVSITLMLLNFVTMVIAEYGVGFIFDTSLGKKADILFLFAVAIVPVFVFSLANLSITTFLEGEGTFKDIFMMVCYSLTPIIISRIVTTILTNVLTMDEKTYVTVITSVATFWIVMLLFVGVMEIHNYSAGRTVASAALTIVAMAIIIFLALLFLDMISRIFGFGYSLVQEIQTRM